MSSHLIITNKGKQFGIDIKAVKEILPLKTSCEYPSCSKYIVGGVNVRGAVIPLIDLRLVFGESTMRADREATVKRVEHGEQELVEWFDALVSFARDGKEFSGSSDPRNSSFGKWLSVFKPNDQGLERILARFTEVFSELDKVAESVLEGSSKSVMLVEEARVSSMVRLKRLMGEFKHSLIADLRQLFLVLSSRQGDYGLIVDSVESLRDFSGLRTTPGKHPLVTSVWSSSKEVIYELALDDLFSVEDSGVSLPTI